MTVDLCPGCLLLGVIRSHHQDMNVLMFRRVRTAIQNNTSPGQEPEVAVVEENLRETLMASGVFEEVEVEHTDDPDQLVIALCQFRPFYTERDVAMRLEEIWKDRVRYPFWAAHAIQTDDGHVEFQAASRPSEEGGYVTVHLVAQRAGIPSQRVASS
jgi:hypothetical protein